MPTEVLFVLGVFGGVSIGALLFGSFKNTGVRIGLLIATIGAVVWLFIQLLD